jgi:hypothetical protein
MDSPDRESELQAEKAHRKNSNWHDGKMGCKTTPVVAKHWRDFTTRALVNQMDIRRTGVYPLNNPRGEFPDE